MSIPESTNTSQPTSPWTAPMDGTAAQLGRAFYRQGMALAARQLQACSDHVARLADCNSPVEAAVVQADLMRTLTQNGIEEGRLLLEEVRQGVAQVGGQLLANGKAIGQALGQTPQA